MGITILSRGSLFPALYQTYLWFVTPFMLAVMQDNEWTLRRAADLMVRLLGGPK